MLRDVHREVSELHGDECGERVGPEPARDAAGLVDDAPQLRCVGVECDRDGLADRRPGPKRLRIGQRDLGLGVDDLCDDFDRLHEASPSP